MSKKKKTSEAIIDFKNIYVNYDINIPVLKNINLNINKGEHWVILGSNGSGKTTLIKLMSNDIYPNTKYDFTKKIFGEERWDIFELKKNLGIITNDIHNFYETNGKNSTAYEVILSGYYSSIQIYQHQNFTKNQRKKALEVLDYLDILEIKDKKVYKMSTGQLRRCIIGRALIHDPKAFILDEPTVGLDIKAQNSFIKLLQKLSKSATLILVTHHIEEIFPEITNVALINNKTIFKQGKKEEILNSENLSKTFDIKVDLKKENDRYYIKSVN
ncbi:MAG: ABC transporter ATP-binding protein [Fusobacteriota bacterium]